MRREIGRCIHVGRLHNNGEGVKRCPIKEGSRENGDVVVRVKNQMIFSCGHPIWVPFKGGVCGQRQNLDRHISQSEGQCQSDLLLGSSCFGVVEVDVIAHVG